MDSNRFDLSSRRLLRNLFPSFATEWPALVPLLVRAALGASVLVQGWLCFAEHEPMLRSYLVGIAAVASGILLLIGFLTPLVGAALGYMAIGCAFALLPVCKQNLLDATLTVVFAAVMLLAILMLGPGSFSVDARLFGRREIIPPSPRTRPSER